MSNAAFLIGFVLKINNHYDDPTIIFTYHLLYTIEAKGKENESV